MQGFGKKANPTRAIIKATREVIEYIGYRGVEYNKISSTPRVQTEVSNREYSTVDRAIIEYSKYMAIGVKVCSFMQGARAIIKATTQPCEPVATVDKSITIRAMDL